MGRGPLGSGVWTSSSTNGGQGVEGRRRKLEQMLPKPFSFIVTAQASISGSASGSRATWNKSLLICKLGIITPPHKAVLEIEPYQETQSSHVATLTLSRSTPREPGKAGGSSSVYQAPAFLPAPPSCTKSVPGCRGNLFGFPASVRVFLGPQGHSPSPLHSSHRVGALRGPVHLLRAGRRRPINQSINSKQMRTSCLSWNPGPSLRLP